MLFSTARQGLRALPIRTGVRTLHQSSLAPANKKISQLFDQLADPAKAPRDLRFAIPPGKKYVTVDTTPRSKQRHPEGWAKNPETGRAMRVPIERTPEEQAEFERKRAEAAANRPRPEYQVFGSGKLNPFLPSRTPEGYYRPPIYSSMKQANVIKQAYTEGRDLELPPSPKKTKYQGRIDWWKEQRIREINEDPVQQAAFNTAFSDAAKFLSPEQDTVFAYQCAHLMMEDQGTYKGRNIFWKGTKRVKRMLKRRGIIEERMSKMPEMIKEAKADAAEKKRRSQNQIPF